MFKIILALTYASAALTTPILKERTASCSPGLHMIAARGSTEAPGEGRIASVTSAIKKVIPGSSSEGIAYPATLEQYESSESQGVVAMIQAITSYATACPDSKIALLGYSQGAQVIGDALGGGSFNASAPINTNLTKNYPAHVAGKSYDVGTSTNNGVFPRNNTAALDAYSCKLQSYCIQGDEFCDNGDNVFIHLSEVTVNAPAAVQFVISKAKAAGL